MYELTKPQQQALEAFQNGYPLEKGYKLPKEDYESLKRFGFTKPNSVYFLIEHLGKSGWLKSIEIEENQWVIKLNGSNKWTCRTPLNHLVTGLIGAVRMALLNKSPKESVK